MKAPVQMDRRGFLALAGAGAAGLALPSGLAAFARASEAPPSELRIQAASYRLRDAVTENMVSVFPDAPPPVLRMREGVPFSIDVTNTLEEASTMHWHGIRVPNKMDGVPYLTQWPIQQGETWRYSYTPKDAGTYWYHPHCQTMEQMARGLTGIIVVAETDDPGFDGETVLNLRDFRIGKDDQFMKLFSARMAARGGTLGTVMTANWEQNPIYEHPAGSLVRLRIAATDTTRIYTLTMDGADGRIVAADGHPLREELPWPTAEAPITVAPGQRLDVALRMPETEGQDVVVTYRTPMRVQALATLRATGSNMGRALEELRPLPPNRLADFDQASSEIIELVFGWSPGGLKPNYGFCGSPWLYVLVHRPEALARTRRRARSRSQISTRTQLHPAPTQRESEHASDPSAWAGVPTVAVEQAHAALELDRYGRAQPKRSLIDIRARRYGQSRRLGVPLPRDRTPEAGLAGFVRVS